MYAVPGTEVSSEKVNEEIYNVHWEGPYQIDSIESERDKQTCYSLYSVYGRHVLYGGDILLYIGRTYRDIEARLVEHSKWIGDYSDDCKIFIASIGKFSTWNNCKIAEKYSAQPNKAVVNDIEKLLIYAHSPVFNSSSINRLNVNNNLRIFNTGKYGSLFPELSTRYHAE